MIRACQTRIKVLCLGSTHQRNLDRTKWECITLEIELRCAGSFKFYSRRAFGVQDDTTVPSLYSFFSEHHHAARQPQLRERIETDDLDSQILGGGNTSDL